MALLFSNNTSRLSYVVSQLEVDTLEKAYVSATGAWYRCVAAGAGVTSWSLASVHATSQTPPSPSGSSGDINTEYFNSFVILDAADGLPLFQASGSNSGLGVKRVTVPVESFFSSNLVVAGNHPVTGNLGVLGTSAFVGAVTANTVSATTSSVGVLSASGGAAVATLQLAGTLTVNPASGTTSLTSATDGGQGATSWSVGVPSNNPSKFITVKVGGVVVKIPCFT
jgi:hypothetical protein